MYWQDATASLLHTLTGHNRLGLITDVDGTISPIVNQPDAAQVTPRSRDLLRALHGHLALVAAISGRAASDVQARVGLPELVYVGNHGLETWINGQVALAPAAAAYRPALEAALAAVRRQQLPGMLVEDKGATASVHYRQTADPPATAAAFTPVIESIAAQHDLRLYHGRMVFELRPPIDVNKGTAFVQLVTDHQLDAAVYLGDDTTDADALLAAQRLRADGSCFAVGLGVESEHTPQAVRDSADLFVRGVQDVETFLSWLLNTAIASST
ncbi:MAG: trehalose-phosphatase [Anaerolineae bacterium]|nr:trehalose-phosphatase [Anaerolineae bacterium]